MNQSKIMITIKKKEEIISNNVDIINKKIKIIIKSPIPKPNFNILRIGSHIKKENTIFKSLVSYYEELLYMIGLLGNEELILPPCQIFFRAPQTGKGGNHSESDLIQSFQYIEKNNIKLYVHGAYIINLSRPQTKQNPLSEKWILGLIIADLQAASAIGGKGVVVHVGKEVKQGKEYALNKMESSIRYIMIEAATEKCPLLIETSAGEGTELCSTIEELSSFYQRFNNDEKKKIKICVDTCHVFAAGYDPLDFIMNWEKLHPDSIALVHFNDAAKEKGSHLDRHEYYKLEKGHIGLDQMYKIAFFCENHNISMVVE